MIYLYAIGDPQPGVDGIRHGCLEAFVRRGIEQAPAPDEESLRHHDGVVSALMRGGAVLPMRFGTVVPSEDDVRDLLVQREDELRSKLEQVRGRVEMGVRVPWEGERIVASSGSEFMRAKFERRKAARRAANELHPVLSELAVDSVLTICPREDTAFTAAYLVDRAQVGRFTQRAKSVTVTGPWPPYSFSG